MSAMIPSRNNGDSGRPPHPGKMVIADDHEMVRTGLALRLSQSFPKTEIVEANCFACLKAACGEDPRPDLVIVDLKMPDGNWRSELRSLRETCPETRVLVFSGIEDAAVVRQILPELAHGFIPKSADGHTLLSAVRLVMDGGVYVPLTALEAGSDETEAEEAPPPEGPALPLTPRQVEVLRMIAVGKANKQIAYELNLSVGTVKIHVSNILDALGATNRTQAIVIARERYGMQVESGA